jgi:peptidoglycan L-alanyl-D-glutamate endopeptidase CwlK
MTLRETQWKFLKDVALLIAFIDREGYSASGGELQRTIEQQQMYVSTGKSKTLKSSHIQKLAIDLFIFSPSGEWMTGKKDLQRFGDYWESLDPEYEWGGNWKSFVDTPHFGRKLFKKG